LFTTEADFAQTNEKAIFQPAMPEEITLHARVFRRLIDGCTINERPGCSGRTEK
jgi:hypothetical protein